MQMVLTALMLAGLVPLGLALRANRRTSLAHALAWGLSAWLSWGLAFAVADGDQGRYCALGLTGCAGVAVLGARRPGVFAWNFVVVGLVAVMVLPLIETAIIGTRSADGLRIFFLAGTIAVGIINYLPTRLAPAAFLLMLVCAGEITLLDAPAWLSVQGATLGFDLLLTAVPWIAWICLDRKDAERSEFDRLWLSFRDRWGLVWSQRVREQFNHAAENAGWPVQLMWRGLTREKSEPAVTPADQEKFVATLRATLQRFLAADHDL
jgi:hypothetical protein